MTNLVAAMIVLSIIFGAVWGAIYSRLYNSIPGVGIMKGLCFGLLLWLIKDVMGGLYIAFTNGNVNIPVGLIWIGIFTQAVFGSLLGVLTRSD